MSRRQEELAAQGQINLARMEANAADRGMSVSLYAAKVVAVLVAQIEDHQRQIDALEEKVRRGYGN